MPLLVPAERFTLSHPAKELKNKAELSQWERKENVGFIWGRKFLHSASSEDKDMKQASLGEDCWCLVLVSQFCFPSTRRINLSAFLGSETWHGREHHHPCQRGAVRWLWPLFFFFFFQSKGILCWHWSHARPCEDDFPQHVHPYKDGHGKWQTYFAKVSQMMKKWKYWKGKEW